MDDITITEPAGPSTEGSTTSVIVRVASRYGVDPAKLLGMLKATAFHTDKAISNEQMMMLLLIADQYHLNPLLRELHALPDKGGIIPVVGIDGWAKIVNEHPQFDGINFSFEVDGGACISCTCTIHRKDRSHPIAITEYFAECKRNSQPWTSHPRRMLRHKAMIQCARIAFGFAGIYDPDEAERIAQGSTKAATGLDTVRAAIAAQSVPVDVIDAETGEISPPVEPPKKAKGKAKPPPNAEPAEPTYAQLADAVLNAGNAAAAEIELDMARGVLPDDQYEELCVLYRNKWRG